MSNIYPISDEKGLLTTPHSFTITNNCTTPVAVQINLESLNIDNKLATNYVKFNLDNGDANYTQLLSNTQTRTATISGATSNNLDNVYLASNSSKSFNLRLWVDYATTLAQGSGKTYQGKIVAVANPTTTYEPSFDGNPDTLLYALKNGNYLYTNSLTTPGSQVSTLSESVIDKTEDDYGTSYYFRGNPNNNYVVFNNMCWRIVRITGDGSIKLILHNERGTDCNIPNYSYNYARWNGSSTTSAFNNVSGVYNTATGSGFMYGNPAPTGSTDNDKYLEAQANTTDSTILTNLKSWYDRVFTTDDAKNVLADTIWCGDKSLYSGLGYGQTYSSYGAYLRLVSNKTPSLVCPDAGTDGMLSKYTAEDTTNGNGLLKTTSNGTTKYYKIGLLTADEAAFAGGVYGVRNNTYYLYNGDYYWLLSPFLFYAGGMIAGVWYVGSTGHLNNGGVSGGNGVRPAVSLKSTASVSGGNGTINNPYIIG